MVFFAVKKLGSGPMDGDVSCHPPYQLNIFQMQNQLVTNNIMRQNTKPTQFNIWGDVLIAPFWTQQ